MRNWILFFLVFLSSITFSQSVTSPKDFLGYDIGSRYTCHYKVVDYFKKLATERSDKIKIEFYGKTNENRDLLLAYVSSSRNISQLEEIRKNNLRLCGVLTDKPGDVNMPSIVWLSYNVHGNETSSTEVSIKVLYELVSGKNDDVNKWLENTVVIIDPCLNPDGRDRYVNWFNQMVGKNPNADPAAREHEEPWPGGRSNHYNFDLNRDWAWQTQVESAQRIKIYNQWMPEIHCDFHEQSPESPYYFAPAAEPYHEVITPFQRSFQVAIGKNHAKYFDANGWLYFTKEIFDLFYPSYGDTYPIYSGSIGMTYEQAGNSSAGASIRVAENDTLSLSDRIAHHFTTSLSTIEMSSVNSKKINDEFKKYFDDLKNNGSGTYKSYVVSGSNSEKLSSLMELFEKNNISYGYGVQGTVVKGFNYFTGKEQSYNLSAEDLIVSTMQPKGALVRVLFEPQSKLSDSVTYDITAWSVPYAYGIDCYAVKEKIPAVSNKSNAKSIYPANQDFAYLIGYNSFNDGKLLAALLNNGIDVRYAESDFSFNGIKYSKGTLIVLRNTNKHNIDLMLKLCSDFNAKVSGISSGFMETGFDLGSDKIHKISGPRVALVSGDNTSSTAVGEVWHLFDTQLNYSLTLVNASSIENAELKNFDVLILPDGNYKFLTDKESNIRNWVKQGGKIIALEGAVSNLASGDWNFKQKEDKIDDKPMGYSDIKPYAQRERQSVANNTPGAIYKVELDNTHPLAFGYPSFYYSLKMNPNVYEFMKEGWNVGVIKQDKQLSGFVGSKAADKIKDGTVIGTLNYGKGTIVFFADNPIFRSFWENGKLIFTNAVFLVN